MHALVQHLLAEPVAAEFEWTIEDHDAPETTIVSGPPAELAPETLAQFVFSSNELDASYECAIDPIGVPEFSSCAGATPDNFLELDREPGPHTILVRAIDPSENFDATPESFSWTVIGPPITTITSGPGELSVTEATSATFEFTADQTGVTFECSLDGEPFAACTSPVNYTEAQLTGTDLNPFSVHTFAVQASKTHVLPGEPEPLVLLGEPVIRTWEIVDRTAPQTSIDSGPSGTTTNNDVVITFSANELEVEFQCSLNGAALRGLQLAVRAAEQRHRRLHARGVRDRRLRQRRLDAGQPRVERRGAAAAEHVRRHQRGRQPHDADRGDGDLHRGRRRPATRRSRRATRPRRCRSAT